MIMERPILYSTPMVLALLDGRKRVTRRLIGLDEVNISPDDWLPRARGMFIDKKGRFCYQFYKKDQREVHAFVKCPYGNVGDILYVREKWCAWDDTVHFAADYSEETVAQSTGWKPSIHLKKANSRIWLKITGIRLERLQAIQYQDSINEGVERLGSGFKNYRQDILPDISYWENPFHSFQSLWESVHGSENWELHPWVWVIDFEILSTTGRSVPADQEEAGV